MKPFAALFFIIYLFIYVWAYWGVFAFCFFKKNLFGLGLGGFFSIGWIFYGCLWIDEMYWGEVLILIVGTCVDGWMDYKLGRRQVDGWLF